MADFLTQREGDASARDEARLADARKKPEAPKPPATDPFVLRRDETETRATALHHAVTTRPADATPDDIVKNASVYLEFLKGNPEVSTHASADPTD